MADGLSDKEALRRLLELKQLGIRLWLEDGRLRFKARKGAMTEAIKADLKAHKQDFIDALAHAEQATTNSSLAPAPPDVAVRATFAQESLWFRYRMFPEDTSYNMGSPFFMHGPQDVLAIEQVWALIIERHDALRTSIRELDEKPHLFVAAPSAFSLPLVDFSGLPQDVAKHEVERLVQAWMLTPFRLEKGPLLRLSMFRISSDLSAYCSLMHHIISDGISLSQISGEMMHFQAAVYGMLPMPEPLPFTFRDYAWHIQQTVNDTTMVRYLDWWCQRLAHVPSVDWITDRPRPKQPRYRGDHLMAIWTGPILTQLQNFGLAQSTSTFKLLMASLFALYQRTTGCDDLVIGTAHAGRDLPETQGMVGMFVNMLALRTNPNPNLSFAAFLGQVSKTIDDAMSHSQVPFDRIVNRLNPDRSNGRHPLFVTQTTYLKGEEIPIGEEGAMEGIGLKSHAAQMDLTITIIEVSDRITIQVDFDVDLFEKRTVERLMHFWRELTSSALDHPEQALSRLDLLDISQKEAVLRASHGGRSPFVPFRPIHEVVQQRALEHGKKTAVIDENHQLTYARLEHVAKALASELRALGAGPERPVAILAARDVLLVVAELAVFKAGAVLLPLDAHHPVERLRTVVEDARAEILVLADELTGVGGALPVSRHLIIDEYLSLDGEFEYKAPKLVPENGAYIIYTSGSTGKPKGVVVSHGGFAQLFHWQRTSLPVEDIRYLQTGAPAFDLSIWEIWCHLGTGATVFFPDEETRHSPERLWPYIEEHQINRSFMPTPLAEAMLRARPEGAACLKLLAAGGEALRIRQSTAYQGDFYNLYGPTETTVCVTATPVVPTRTDNDPLPTLGKPMQGTSLYILDRHLQPVPDGMPGELVIGGGGVSRGYLGRPGVTAGHFVPDPFSHQPGRRLYLSGDLVMRDQHNEIRYISRIDNQVKLHGNRLEIGEIEAHLMARKELREVAVVVRSENGQVLTAYLHPGQPDDGTLVESLRAELAGKLPEYMVPTSWMILDALPMTPSGKINRRALATEPCYAAELDHIKGRAPQTPVERKLAELWAEVLEHDTIDDVALNFFTAGGYSISAVSLVGRISEAFGHPLELTDLFANPTIEGLACILAEAGITGTVPIVKLPKPKPVTRQGELPLSFSQERLWVLENLGEMGATYHIPLLLELTGPLDVSALFRAIDGVVARHESLRTTLHPGEAAPNQLIHDTLPVVGLLEEIPEARLSEDALYRHLGDTAALPFDFERGPLFRVRLIRRAPERHLLALVFHHIIFDGWSAGIFSSELAEYYRAALAYEQVTLPKLALQSVDLAVWQRTAVASNLERLIDWWRDYLHGAAAHLELPTDRRRPREQSHEGAQAHLQLPREVTEALEAYSANHGATLYMTLLAAFKIVLSHYGAGRDLVVGSPIAGRNRREAEPLIGFFVNTLALRTTWSGDPLFDELLALVRERVLGAFAHDQVPFEKLVEELQPQRDTSRAPIFQVMFVLQNVPGGGGLQMPGLAVRGGELDMGTAQFELSMVTYQTPAGLGATLGYNRDLFAPATINGMLACYGQLLQELAERPARRLSQIPMLDRATRKEILTLSAGLPAAEIPFQPLHHHVESWREKDGERLALHDETLELSFEALGRYSDRLAGELQAQGVQSEQAVAILAPRGVLLAVAELAVLKTGATFLPLDPVHPTGRLKQIVEDAAVRIVLCTESTSATITEIDTGLTPLVIERVRPTEEEYPKRLQTEIAPEMAAYLIYTSGTTGVPKGVVGTHGALHHLYIWYKLDMPHRERITAMQMCGPAFDVSLLEFWCNLAQGYSLYIPDEDVRRSPVELWDYIEEHEIQRSTSTPVITEAMLQEKPKGRPHYREMGSGGEALRLRPSSEYQGQYINFYGPTETTVISTAQVVAPAKTETDPLPELGRPLRGLRIYVLDARLELVARGAPGELCIAGGGVTRGYFGQPRITAEKFVPDPYGPSGSRCYRTGDLGRYDGAGLLTYLGRTDLQVKLHGNRLEIGEIEAHLEAHEQVAQAAVVLDEETGPVLVAYVVPAARAESGLLDRLRAWLRERLPAYMVPRAWMQLDRLPQTPNGKLDRNALPKPELHEGSQEPPRDEIEIELAELWAEVLGGEPPTDVRADFFALGGYSLSGIRLLKRIEAEFHVTISPRQLFAEPTIAGLARVIRGDHAPEPMIRLLAGIGQDDDPIYLIPALDGEMSPYRELVGALGSDRPVYGIRARGLEPGEEPVTQFAEMVAADAVTIETSAANRPITLVGWSYGGLLAQELARTLHNRGCQIAGVFLLDSYAGLAGMPFDERQSALDFATVQAILAGKQPFLSRSQLDGHEGASLTRMLLVACEAHGISEISARADMMRRWKVYRARAKALTQHHIEPYPEPMVLITASQRPAHLDERFQEHGWQRQGQETRDYEMATDHHGLLTGSHAHDVAALIKTSVR